jgi:serine/threonine-protein kinase
VAKVVESFGKYVLLEKIASGGMAEVYLAKSTGASGVSKFLAVKRILPQYSDNPEFIEMFKEEAKIAVNLNHGNVVSIFDFGVEKQQFFLVMEYVEGQNLRQVLNHLKRDTKNFTIDQIVYIIKEVSAGLDHAHRCLDGTTGKPLNITHRDMSPQNVMLSFEGEVKIVDFGIAKAESQMETTRAGTIKGKFGYMSPEQADGQTVDLRTDIFSLGIILWELLANDRLFQSNSDAGTLRKIRECQIPPLRKLNPSVPPELERICNKALAKDKGLRYQTSAAFHRDLNRFLNTQYPEFSPHDFSVFMKSAFSQMFIENRKKLIEFAKIQGTSDDRTSMTSTATLTETTQDFGDEPQSKDHEGISGFGINAPSTHMDLSELNSKVKSKVFKAPKSSVESSWNKRPAGRGTQSSIRPPQKSSSSSVPWISLILLVLVGGSVFFFWKQNTRTFFPGHVASGQREQPVQPQPQRQQLPVAAQQPVTVPNPRATTGKIESASKQPLAVFFDCEPHGAHIFLNGQDTGMFTPARQTVDAYEEFTVSFRLDGYQYYEKRERATSPGYQIKASLLPMPKMGYISLDVINGGSNPVVFINGQRVNDNLPLRNYAIPAGQAVRIQAHNPFTGLAAEQVVTVGYNQKRQINLILSQQRQPSNQRHR